MKSPAIGRVVAIVTLVAASASTVPGAAAQFRFESTPFHGSVGFDAPVTDWLTVGFARRYQRNTFNGSAYSADVGSDGVEFVTYLGAVFSESLSAELVFQHSDFSLEPLQSSQRMRGTSYSVAEQLYASGNVNYDRSFGDWRLSARGGLFWLRDRQEAPADDNSTLPGRMGQSLFAAGRANIGGEIARMFGSFEPFASATYSYSFSPSPTRSSFGADGAGGGVDRTDLRLGVGARYFSSETMSGSLQFNTLLGRHNSDDYSINLLIRADF